MDINELLHREQVSLANATNATCRESRRAHEGLARGYGDKLRIAGFPHRRYEASATGAERAHATDLAGADQ